MNPHKAQSSKDPQASAGDANNSSDSITLRWLAIAAVLLITVSGAGMLLLGPPGATDRHSDSWKSSDDQKLAIGKRVRLNAASVMIGAFARRPEEGPARDEVVPALWVLSHEVTNDEFARFIDATGYVTSAEEGYEDLGPGSTVFDPQQLNNLSWNIVNYANVREPYSRGNGSATSSAVDNSVLSTSPLSMPPPLLPFSGDACPRKSSGSRSPYADCPIRKTRAPVPLPATVHRSRTPGRVCSPCSTPATTATAAVHPLDLSHRIDLVCLMSLATSGKSPAASKTESP